MGQGGCQPGKICSGYFKLEGKQWYGFIVDPMGAEVCKGDSGHSSGVDGGLVSSLVGALAIVAIVVVVVVIVVVTMRRKNYTSLA